MNIQPPNRLPQQPFKVLSLMQPWATLVVLGAKQIETRSWTAAYRGPLLIHASLSKAGRAFAGNELIRAHIPDFNSLPFGAIIGEATLTDIVRVESLLLPASDLRTLSMEEKAFGDYTAGRYAWLLKNATQWPEPIGAKGKLGLWEY